MCFSIPIEGRVRILYGVSVKKAGPANRVIRGICSGRSRMPGSVLDRTILKEEGFNETVTKGGAISQKAAAGQPGKSVDPE